MGMTPTQLDEWAAVLTEARRSRVTREAITATHELSVADAYAIQQRVTAVRLARGEHIVGWKLGYTSLAMREQMGVHEPNFGPLTDAMVLADGAQVIAALIHPRVEPEIGLRFARPLAGEVSIDDVLAAVEECFACLEVVDSVYTDYRFRLEDNTADGSSAAQVVVGPAFETADLAAVHVELTHNSTPVAHATGAAASGHPAAGVAWLVARLAERGQRVEPGQIVITGGLTKAVALMPGDTIGALFDGSVAVAVSRS